MIVRGTAFVEALKRQLDSRQGLDPYRSDVGPVPHVNISQKRRDLMTLAGHLVAMEERRLVKLTPAVLLQEGFEDATNNGPPTYLLSRYGRRIEVIFFDTHVRWNFVPDELAPENLLEMDLLFERLSRQP
jgi:hypothetical protein